MTLYFSSVHNRNFRHLHVSMFLKKQEQNEKISRLYVNTIKIRALSIVKI